MINRKAKGTKGERELVQFFNENNWACIRAAGSGSSRYPSPDILAANAIRRVAIECKVTKDQKKYFSKEEIEQLRIFSQNFGAESWVGVKFAGEDWFFLMLEDLERTGNLWAVDINLAKLRGLRKEELIKGISGQEISSSSEKTERFNIDEQQSIINNKLTNNK